MKSPNLFRALAAALIASGVVVACTHTKSDPDTTPSPPLPMMGESTAPGPSNPNVQPPDSAGVPTPDQKTPPANGPTTMLESADYQPMASDAGVPMATSDAAVPRALTSDAALPGPYPSTPGGPAIPGSPPGSTPPVP